MEGHLFDSDDAGNTALHLAAYFGQLSMVEYLVRTCGFDVKDTDKVGLHCLLLVWCILWPLWTHLLHGHSGHGHLYLCCVNLFVLYSLIIQLDNNTWDKNGRWQLRWMMVMDSLPATRGLWRMIAKNNDNDLGSNISRFGCWNITTPIL